MCKLSKNQAGVTLVEMMIGLALSMIVVSSMVVLMANSLGTASRIIQMTQLTDDMRNTVNMVARDIRRANYSANAYRCFANSDCGVDGSANQVEAVINANCLIFNLDRNQDGDASTDNAGGFRRIVVGGVGVIEMWVGDESAACNDAENLDNDDWIALSDPEFIDFTEFNFGLVDYTEDLTEESGAVLTQHTREIEVDITAALVLDPSITRNIQDKINLRNDFLERTAP